MPNCTLFKNNYIFEKCIYEHIPHTQPTVPLTSLHYMYVYMYMSTHACRSYCVQLAWLICPGLTTWDQLTCVGAHSGRKSPSFRTHCPPITCHKEWHHVELLLVILTYCHFADRIHATILLRVHGCSFLIEDIIHRCPGLF